MRREPFVARPRVLKYNHLLDRLKGERSHSPMNQETAFERPRGVSHIEVREGFAQVHVSKLDEPSTDRLRVLQLVAQAGVSIDFVKLTPTGFSFVIAQNHSESVAAALRPHLAKDDEDQPHFRIRDDRSIVLVHAVNIRDEEGLIAKIVRSAIATSAHVDHIGDMHDRLLMVVQADDAERLKLAIEQGQREEGWGESLPASQPFRHAEVPSKTKGIKVMKFGGTSVATNKNRMLAALKVVSAKEQGYQPVVVVSAIGRKGDPYATDTLLAMLKEIDPSVEPDPREVDLLMGCGEILSSVIFSHTLRTLGHSATSFRGGQAGIRTDGVFGNARIVGINPVSILKSIEAGSIPVVCGFQGVYISGDGAPGGELTTLGRGGSDTTASAVGAALNADAVEIFTDVEGVKTADPDMVANAPTLRKVTYDEVAEIAHLGAKVVHPRAAEIAMKFDIPLWVKSTFSDDEGTEIVSRNKFPGRRVTGVTHTGKLVYLQFRMGEASDEDRATLESRLYEAVARFNVNLHMVNLSPSGTGFAVPRDQYSIVRIVLDGLVVPVAGTMYLLQVGAASAEVETQAKLLEDFGNIKRICADLTEGCTMVSVVGHEYMQQPGVFYRALKELHDAGIPVLQTTDSDFSLSCLIPESECHRAVRLLHAAFPLAEAQ